MKFGLKKLETSIYRAVQSAFQYLEPSVTDGSTDRTAVSDSAV